MVNSVHSRRTLDLTKGCQGRLEVNWIPTAGSLTIVSTHALERAIDVSIADRVASSIASLPKGMRDSLAQGQGRREGDRDRRTIALIVRTVDRRV